MLFVLAPGLAPLKCWLAAMTQRYSIREGTNRREQVREKEVLRLSPLSQCASRPRFFPFSAASHWCRATLHDSVIMHKE